MGTWVKTGMQMVASALLACATHVLHLQLITAGNALPQRQDARETLPSTEALKFMSLGYRTSVADYYWLRAVSHFGDRHMHKFLYPNLAPLLERVVALDPLFAGAYIFAGQTLTFKGMDWNVAMALLRQGFAMRPDDWRIGLHLGFNAYYLMQDYKLAAATLAQVAKDPKAPPFLGELATRLAAEAGTPEMGLTLVDTMLSGTQDPKVRASYLERRSLLLLELALRDVQNAVNTYRQQHNDTPPQQLKDLVQAGLLPSIPADPLGGHFWLDANGTVRTHHETQRLRVHGGATQSIAHDSH